MAITNAQLADIFKTNHMVQMAALERVEERVGGVEKHLAQLNGAVTRNAADIADQPCKEHGESIVALETVVGLSPNPREAGRAEAIQEQHSVNWTLVVAIVSTIVASVMTAVAVGNLIL